MTGEAIAEAPVGATSAAVRLRRFPYPFRAMLAICSDIDRTTPRVFAALHRFLNTEEETPMGRGLGLDIADSMWFYAPRAAVGEPADRQMSVFDGLDWTRRSPYAEQILDYVRGGWIDTLHTYGNFSLTGSGGRPFERRHAEAALEVLAEAGLSFKVWVNHGNRFNTQNVGTADYMAGDVPGDASWHSDLMTAHGVCFMWSGRLGAEFVQERVLSPYEMADGRTLWAFSRQEMEWRDDAEALATRLGAVTSRGAARPFVMLWHPQLLHLQLSAANLQRLVANGGFAILGQHFGTGQPLRRFGAPAVAALRRLKEAEEAGDICVARTSRLLEYAAAHAHLRYTAAAAPDGTLVIDIEAIDDPVRGVLAPTPERVRGITFEVPDAGGVELRLAGVPLEPGLRLDDRTPGGDRVVGIRWHEPDTTDYTHGERLTMIASPAADLTSRLVAAISKQADARPPHIPQAKWDYAVRYARDRYAVGLDHYRRAFHEMGLTGKRHGLDIGSGAGHWCLAFAHDSARATGIDINEHFVRLANHIAEEAGFGDRVRHQVANAEALPFADDHFDVVWSHGVLMFSDLERSISEIARVLRKGGHFYCGYSSTGFRLSGIYSGITLDRPEMLKAQVCNFVGSTLVRDGIPRPPWSSINRASLDELLAIGKAFGLTFIDEPGLQDGQRRFAGLPGTIDFLCKRDGDRDSGRTRLRALSPKEDRAAYEDALGLGLGRLVREVIAERGDDLADAEIRDLYVRASLRAGALGAPEIAALRARGVSPRTAGLIAFQERRFDEAAERFAALDADEVDRPFLVGTAELAAGRPAEAIATLEAGIEADRRPIESRIAIMLARIETNEMGGHKKAMAQVLYDLVRVAGANADDVEVLMRALR